MTREASHYVAQVRPRWSDMDAFGHVNHARLVTLLEEARVPLLFGGTTASSDDAGLRRDHGHHASELSEFAKGIVVVRLHVDYRAPIVVDGRAVRVEITLTDLRFASFTLDYRVRTGPAENDTVAATAATVLAPYDLERGRPRRLSEAERAFLTEHVPSGGRV
ncbi:thioesterase family protein [Saccharomonospora xinjiangensis]|uniref:acyl-CoA thioesterase n=1 Tax=Saccharomonospora xinjiangensis TaxID=75294 RepID=UPI001070037E|nr:thioesterase family protein [Saccharomonospora xinjiangensis]QBQ59666.1 acyl-CoA thioesterase YbgC [Saccharomonospora xinjiangensis]